MSDDKLKRAKAAETLGLGGVTKAPPPAPKLPSSYIPDRNAVARLAAMGDPEKADLWIEVQRKRVPVQDFRRVEPDPKHWSLNDDWEIVDGALLLVNLEPREGLGARLHELQGRKDVAGILHTILKRDELPLFEHVKTIVDRASATNGTLVKQYVMGRGVHIARPADFVAWALTRSPVPVPEWMKALAEPSVDYEALIQSLRDSRDRISAELSEARAENVRLNLQLAQRSASEPAEKRPSKIVVANMKEAYESLARPSMRQVAKITGYDRNTQEFKAAYAQIEAEAK